jgi:MFS family permease
MVVQTAADETQPLLADASTGATPGRSKSKKLMILLMCSIFVLAADFGSDMALAPETAIFEKIICRNQGLLSRGEAPPTGNLPVDGSDPCKSEAVQAELALLLGYKSMFEVLPGIFLSLPYGVLSDHWGRKPVIYLGIVGLLLGELWVRLVGKLGSFDCPGLRLNNGILIGVIWPTL